ncbi:MAG: hypothetical protein A3F35_00240 [Candidatus Woykebacteria bacterium RIFCSPHIGHO2_12_FULL_45_10]|uniref:Phosphoribose diphosphate--decaprenyl-phosphate phosphoribosyltransferase n=1 Tax=Candidatus Woykebacteria bacterium RIFCSPHIGHO2_12_FULL_45_10 TaxID=1802603 RepID=A0A1G1WNR9_9BACT|nr:MAG: hypothetical protein A3F35_00240 [Candidatus Woykebacteria bacterium RIFCSPHIGHO2_12_FULL_45_10]
MVKQLFISTRPAQWVKNLAVFAAIFFGGKLFSLPELRASSIAFLIFCLAASSTYLFNDLLDAQVDLLHSGKKHRPVAAGLVPKKNAIGTIIILAFLALLVSFYLSITVFFLVGIYLATQVAYNLYLKKVILLELLIIAFGFIIRVFAGSFASGISLSSWLILAVMMLSLFLAIGKRRSEITLLGASASKHRLALSAYPISLLDGLVFLSATSTLVTYSLFTFNQSQFGASRFLTEFLPATLTSPKWLMITIPVVVYGIFRYLYLIFEKKVGDSPEKVLLTDRPLLAAIIVWLLTSGLIIYFLPTT